MNNLTKVIFYTCMFVMLNRLDRAFLVHAKKVLPLCYNTIFLNYTFFNDNR